MQVNVQCLILKHFAETLSNTNNSYIWMQTVKIGESNFYD